MMSILSCKQKAPVETTGSHPKLIARFLQGPLSKKSMWIWVWVVPLVIVVASVIHTLLSSRPRPPGKLLEIWVIHVLFWGVGVMGVIIAYLMGTDPSASVIAKALGWPPASPFQRMAAGRVLAFGIGGIGVIWFRGGWIVAMTIAVPLFGLAQAVLWAIKDVPATMLGTLVVYNVVGGLILIILVISYRWRAGALKFWSHSPSFGER